MKRFPITTILAPTDLSESSAAPLRCSRLLADRFSARLTVMYADPIAYPVDYVVPTKGLYVTPSKEHTTDLREAIDTQARGLMGDTPYEALVTIGQPVPAILAAADERHADLIVMSSHGRRGWRRALLGSVCEGVLHGSRCPVLIVPSRERRDEPQHAIAKILCPINFSPVARQALAAAAEIAAAFGAHLTIVHVIEADDLTDSAADEARVREWIPADLRQTCAYRELVLRGGPAERVLDCADDLGSNLLVIGAQHRIFRDSTVIGTTTERIVRYASCPVLVIPRVAQPATAERAARSEPVLATASGNS